MAKVNWYNLSLFAKSYSRWVTGIWFQEPGQAERSAQRGMRHWNLRLSSMSSIFVQRMWIIGDKRTKHDAITCMMDSQASTITWSLLFVCNFVNRVEKELWQVSFPRPFPIADMSGGNTITDWFTPLNNWPDELCNTECVSDTCENIRLEINAYTHGGDLLMGSMQDKWIQWELLSDYGIQGTMATEYVMTDGLWTPHD